MEFVRNARNNGLYCDVNIILVDQDNSINILCHKILLYSFSQFFRNKMDRWDSGDKWELHVPNAIVTEYLILRECYGEQTTELMPQLNRDEQELWIVICKDYLCIDLKEIDFNFMYHLSIKPIYFELLCRATNCIFNNSYAAITIAFLRNMRPDTNLNLITDKNLLAMLDIYKNNKCYCLLQENSKLLLLDLGAENIKTTNRRIRPTNIERELFDAEYDMDFANTKKGILVYYRYANEITYVTDFILATQFSSPTLLKGSFEQKILFLTTHPNHSIAAIVFDDDTIGILNTETFFLDQRLTQLIKDIPKKISKIDISTDGKFLVTTYFDVDTISIHFTVFDIEKNVWRDEKYSHTSAKYKKNKLKKITFIPADNLLVVIFYDCSGFTSKKPPKIIETCFGIIKIIHMFSPSENRDVIILPDGDFYYKRFVTSYCRITSNDNTFYINQHTTQQRPYKLFRPRILRRDGSKLYFKEYYNIINCCLTPSIMDWRFNKIVGELNNRKIQFDLPNKVNQFVRYM